MKTLCLSRIVVAGTIGLSALASSQTKHGETSAVAETKVFSHLTETETQVLTPATAESSFVSPLVCDEEGNLYLQTEQAGFSTIRKLSPKGETLATFDTASVSDVKPIDISGPFSVSQDGELYQLVFPEDVVRYVAIFDSHGRFKSKVKLDTGFAWTPATVAPLVSGYLLVAGMRYDGDPHVHPMRPFTGIFDSSGSLVKEVNLEDDTRIYEMAAAGDHRVVPPENPSINRAVMRGRAIPAQDGNAYLMRVLSPAMVYGISAGGAVVHRFTVDPGEANYVPLGMHISRDRIAIQFGKPGIPGQRIVVVNTSGEVVANYDDPEVDGKATFGQALACYWQNPDRFVFLSTKDSKLSLRIAGVR